MLLQQQSCTDHRMVQSLYMKDVALDETGVACCNSVLNMKVVALNGEGVVVGVASGSLKADHSQGVEL